MPYSFSYFIRDIYHYVKPYTAKFLIGFFFRITTDLAQLYPAWALSRIIFLFTQEKNEGIFWSIIQLILIWLVLVMYKSVGREIAKYYGFQVAEMASLDLYKDCLKHILTLDLAWQELENSGNKFKRIASGRTGMNEIIRRIFDTFIEVGVSTIGIIIIFSQQNLTITFGLVFFMITFYLLGVVLLKRASYHEQMASKKDEDLGGITFEALNNIRTIKALSIDNKIISIIMLRITKLIDEIRKRIFWFRMQNGVANIYYHAFEIAVISFIAYGVWNGNYNISLLILFVALYQQVGESMWELMEVTQEVVVSKIWVGRAREILDTKPIIESPTKLATQAEFPHNWKEIRIEKVQFMYDTQDVLRNVTLNIKRGEKIGIVGVSGSGKSTLFKLLMDLYENYEGEIYIDNVPLKNIKRQSYINHVSVVLQDTELFNMTLKENITIAAVPAQKEDDELLNSVIKTAHLTEVIADLPQGIDTLVGEKGIKLSGGQRQRVGIARALYRQPDILLLDEATSHLDVHSEREIQQALHEAFGKYTAIVIAHRLSTIREMVRIVVMQNGEIHEQGSFKNLIEKKGIFAKMWNEQRL